VAAVIYSPKAQYNDKPAPTDMEEAFHERFLLITPENSDAIAGEFPEIFTVPAEPAAPALQSTKAEKEAAAAHSPPPVAPLWTKFPDGVRQGAVQVRVKHVIVGKVRCNDMFGEIFQPEDDLLGIVLVASNVSTDKKINYSTWRGQDFKFGRDFASLIDDCGNVYKRITFGVGSKPTGAVDSESIYPGKAVSDVLVFEKPVDAAKWLHLELPAENFGGEGMLRFEIPAKMFAPPRVADKWK